MSPDQVVYLSSLLLCLSAHHKEKTHIIQDQPTQLLKPSVTTEGSNNTLDLR